MKKTLIAMAAAAVAFTGLAAPASADGERFVLVSHAPDSDSWWNTIKNAITVAGGQMGVEVEYRNPPTGDLADMARIIEQAAASNPNGIIATIADYDVLSGPLSNAVAKGIPVITINSGTEEQSKKIGALMHVGQPEYDAGKGAGAPAPAAQPMSSDAVLKLFPEGSYEQHKAPDPSGPWIQVATEPHGARSRAGPAQAGAGSKWD